MSATRGFAVRDVNTGHGFNSFGRVNVNYGKVLPATTTANLFVVTGTIQASLVGVVQTIGGATPVKPTIGVTGKPTALSAAPASGLTTQAVSSVLKLPQVLGAALPVPLVAASAAAGGALFTVSNTTITVTTDATNAMAITWILVWSSLFLGDPSGTTVTNS